ncbi:MAG: hypothetical protein ACRDQ7_24725 [Haloechinothrix sp.]
MGFNIVKLRDWHAVRYRPDPWAALLDEPDPTPTPPKTKRTRPTRRIPTPSELISGAPPG